MGTHSLAVARMAVTKRIVVGSSIDIPASELGQMVLTVVSYEKLPLFV